VAIYRESFRPSDQLAHPHVIAGISVIVDDTDAAAQAQLATVRRARVLSFLARGRTLSDEEAEALVRSPQGRQVLDMMRYAAVGTPEALRDHLVSFTDHARADELIVVPSSPTIDAKVRSLELLAEVAGIRPSA
jgi:alkanesulfonate monooxygenase SsuD/methylene tetrahydromethanopterin reductase-like flavin-dependent oxidoreductase (luciferase family)